MTTFAFNVSDGEEQNPALGLVALVVVTLFRHFKIINRERTVSLTRSYRIVV